MKLFPDQLRPENLNNFKSYRNGRMYCKLIEFIYEFMLSNEFIEGKDRGFNLLSEDVRSLNISSRDIDDILSLIIENLTKLGWSVELSFGKSVLSIQPKGDINKTIKCKSIGDVFG